MHFLRRKTEKSEASSPRARWQPVEQAVRSNFDGTPSQFWGLVGKFVDGFDEQPQHLNAETTEDTDRHEHHFKLDPGDIFERGKTLGRGSVGFVQVMKIKGTDVKVACKATTKGDLFDRLRDEAGLLRKISHKHIVRFIGSFETPDKRPDYGMLMSPVGDQELGGFLTEVGESPSDDLAHIKWLKHWFGCLASALAYLHDRGIRHEDIKPSNIIHRGDRIFFTDFSSSTTFETEGTTSTERTVYNTRRYAAPEFVDEKQVHGTRSDIFPLGCIFLEMLTVISGTSVKGLHDFCKNTSDSSGKAFLYSNVLDHLNSWCLNMNNSVSSKIIWKDIVQPMLHVDRKQRPTAQQTLQLLNAGPIPIILEYSNADCYCGGPILSVAQKIEPEQSKIKLMDWEAYLTGEMSTVESRAERLKQLHLALSGIWLEFRYGSTYHDFDGRFIETLWAASKGGHKELVQFLLHYPLNNHHREIVLAVAALEGHVGIVKILLSRNSELRVPGTCAPIAAAFNKHVEVVQLLVEDGARLDGCSNHRYNLRRDRSGQWSLDDSEDSRPGDFDTALQAAAHSRDETIVKILLDADSDVNNKIGLYGTALTIASYWGDENIVRMLTRSGADANTHGGIYHNPLWAASYRGHDNIVRILLDNGADTNIVCGNSGTALQAALQSKHEKVVQLLREPVADLDVT